jgi:serine phosphatase RsbU (regulator of sigma subunit)
MTLLVVDSGDESVRRLAEALDARGFVVVRVAADDLTTHEPVDDPDLVLCHDTLLDRVRAALPDVSVALVSSNGIDKTRLLQALRQDVVDVFEGNEAADLSARVESVLDRARRRAGAIRGEREQRATEAQLRELQRDQRAGRYVQMGMLPPTPMAVDDYRLRHRILPSLLLSGDFVDYFRIGEQHFAFYIADVSGHGASSAFVTVLLKNFSRRLRREYRPSMLSAPGEILAWLNRELLDNQIDRHVALFLGVVDTRRNRWSYASAGHFPPAMLATRGGARAVELAGKPIGLFRDATWESRTEPLDECFCLSLVSDGVLEVLDKGPLAEKERTLLDAARKSFETGVDIWRVLDLESRQPAPDDMACLMISRGVP